jgi:5-methylcytosine-specific restriction endonuclease McrA
MKPRKPLKRSTKPIARTPIKRAKRHPETRVGKLGRVRLTGKALEDLRRQCFERDNYTCTCGCGERVTWETGDMAHIVSRGAGGSDAIDNVRTLTKICHMKSHNCGGKPLAPPLH